jgi:hypothetical protein
LHAARPEVQAVLGRYEREVDQTLRRVDALRGGAYLARRKAQYARDVDREEGRGSTEGATRLAEVLARGEISLSEIIEVNGRFLPLVEQSLPDEHRHDFHFAAQRLMCRFMHDPPQDDPARLLDQVKSRKDLSESQRERLAALQAQYEAALDHAAPDLTRKYARTISKQACLDRWRVSLVERGAKGQRDAPYPDHGDAKFEEALGKWNSRSADFKARIEAVLNEPRQDTPP